MLTSLTRFTKQPRLSSQFIHLSGNDKLSCYPALHRDTLRFISSPCADVQISWQYVTKTTRKKKTQKTRHSPDKGINKIKSNHRWNSFILNLAIYPDFSVISPPFSPAVKLRFRACRPAAPRITTGQTQRSSAPTGGTRRPPPPFHACAERQRQTVRERS